MPLLLHLSALSRKVQPGLQLCVCCHDPLALPCLRGRQRRQRAVCRARPLSQRYITLSQILLPHRRVRRLGSAVLTPPSALQSAQERRGVAGGGPAPAPGLPRRSARPWSSLLWFAISQMTLQPPWLSCFFCPCCSFTDLSPSP